MPETIEELNVYLAACYSQPPYSTRDSETTQQPQPLPKPIPPHPLSPSAAPPAKRQKSGTPRAPSVDPPSGSPEPSVFNVLNIFRCRWFLHQDHLIANVLSATKDDAGLLDWIDFQPPFHSHLIRKAMSLLPPLCLVVKGKRVIFVFVLEVLNKDSHGSPGHNPGPLAFFNTSKKPSPSAPKKAAASSGVPAPAPPVSDSGVPHLGLRVGGEPTKPRARGVKTKKTLREPGLSREARVAIRAVVASNPLHPEAETLYPPVGASRLDNPIPALLRAGT